MWLPHHEYVMDGDLTSRPNARDNEGFDITNCFFVYNPIHNWVELRLKGCDQPGYYEGLVNYTEPGKLLPYWISHRVSLLPPAAKANRWTFHLAQQRPTLVQSYKTNSSGKSKRKRTKTKKPRKFSPDLNVTFSHLSSLLFVVCNFVNLCISYQLILHISIWCMYVVLIIHNEAPDICVWACSNTPS